MLETTVAEEWLYSYAAVEIDEIGRKLEMKRAERDYQRKTVLDNGIHVLANMYKIYMSILMGENPNLTKKDVIIFRDVLGQFERLVPRHRLDIEYPTVVPELEQALAGIGVYVDARNARRRFKRQLEFKQ